MNKVPAVNRVLWDLVVSKGKPAALDLWDLAVLSDLWGLADHRECVAILVLKVILEKWDSRVFRAIRDQSALKAIKVLSVLKAILDLWGHRDLKVNVVKKANADQLASKGLLEYRVRKGN